MTYLRQRMLEERQRRNHAPATVLFYVRHVAEFAQHFHRSPDQLGAAAEAQAAMAKLETALIGHQTVQLNGDAAERLNPERAPSSEPVLR